MPQTAKKPSIKINKVAKDLAEKVKAFKDQDFAFRLCIKLDDWGCLDFPIYRKVLIDSKSTLADLHNILQICFEWDNSHLHSFEISAGRGNRIKTYEDSRSMDDDFGSDSIPEHKATILSVFNEIQILTLSTTIARLIPIGQSKGKPKFIYIYDFGDNWEGEITFEDIIEIDKDFIPACIEGLNAAPPDDSGGMSGYSHIIEVLKNPKHKDYEDIACWMGCEEDDDDQKFDPHTFDIEELNQLIKKRFLRVKKSRKGK
ncbi:MAG: plasmid pRiA4b ORF-3 family protein [Candidatus Melainabacteria bacterium]